MSLIVVSSDRFAEHQTPPGHPETPGRAEVMDVVADEWRRRERRGRRAARGHARAARTRARPRVPASGSRRRQGSRSRSIPTRTRHRDLRSRAARGRCGVDAVERVMSGTHARALRARATARASRRARPRHGLLPLQQRGGRRGACADARRAQRVAIVDYDVHHGNGTQHIFEPRPGRAVLLDSPVSVLSGHRCGRRNRSTATERGFTVNVPLEVGRDRRGLPAGVRRGRASGAASSSGPTSMLVSAGFDAHERDPLGDMRLTTRSVRGDDDGARGCWRMSAAQGRMVAVTEGGYDLRALARLAPVRSSTCLAAEHRRRRRGRRARWPHRAGAADRSTRRVAGTVRSLARPDGSERLADKLPVSSATAGAMS